jgi:hypothetical protein
MLFSKKKFASILCEQREMWKKFETERGCKARLIAIEIVNIKKQTF